MKKRRLNKVWILLFSVLIAFSFASQSFALEPVSVGDTTLSANGFLRNNYGYFLENHSLGNNDGDHVATNRTWLRLNVDWDINKSLSFYTVGQLVYEPEYDIEKGSVSEENGKEYSEYDDLDDVLREVYFDFQPSNNHSFRVGRQIVVWGESMTTRIGDFVNPIDSSFTFAFANWEDTRIPQWMIKGLHDFEKIGTSIEWLVNPLLTGEEHRTDQTGSMAQFGAGELIEQRFAAHQEDRYLPPYAINNPALGQEYPAVNPMTRDHIYSPYIPGTGWTGTTIPNVEHVELENSFDNIRYGFRTSTFLDGNEFGVSYFHTHMYTPAMKRTNELTPTHIPDPRAPQYFRTYELYYPEIDYFGLYFNKDLDVGLVRAEAIYSPNRTFRTFDETDFDGLTERDYFKYMIAWDINGLFYFDWHKSAPFNLSIEHVAEVVPDNKDLQYAFQGTKQDKYNPSIGINLSTSWFYGLLETRLIASYGFNNNDGLIMPIVKWIPSWRDNAFSAEFRYIGIYGDSNYEGIGMFKEKDMAVLTLQYNF